jgi:hypothetical protein
MSHLETYLDNVKLLPNDLQRYATLMYELDRKCAEANRELISREENFLAQANKEEVPNLDDLQVIRSVQHQLSVYCLERSALCSETYSIITSYLNRLDEDLKLYEQELPADLIREAIEESNQFNNTSTGGGIPSSSYSAKSSVKSKNSIFLNPSKGSVKHNKSNSHRMSSNQRRMVDYSYNSLNSNDEELNMEDLEDVSNSLNDEEMNGAGAVIAMNNDNTAAELFCFCQQPSYGEMIACDDSDCHYEWFHFNCVGLKKQPKGVWFWYWHSHIIYI